MSGFGVGVRNYYPLPKITKEYIFKIYGNPDIVYHKSNDFITRHVLYTEKSVFLNNRDYQRLKRSLCTYGFWVQGGCTRSITKDLPDCILKLILEYADVPWIIESPMKNMFSLNNSSFQLKTTKVRKNDIQSHILNHSGEELFTFRELNYIRDDEVDDDVEGIGNLGGPRYIPEKFIDNVCGYINMSINSKGYVGIVNISELTNETLKKLEETSALDNMTFVRTPEYKKALDYGVSIIGNGYRSTRAYIDKKTGIIYFSRIRSHIPRNVFDIAQFDPLSILDTIDDSNDFDTYIAYSYPNATAFGPESIGLNGCHKEILSYGEFILFKNFLERGFLEDDDDHNYEYLLVNND